MWISPEDARGDIALVAGTAFVVGPAALDVLASVPGFPGGIVGGIVLVLGLLAMTAWPARWLARWRDQGPAAWGLHPQGRDALGTGVTLALPVVLAGLLDGFVGQRGLESLFGRVPRIAGGVGSGDVLALLLATALVAATAVSIVLAHGTISNRAEDAFRSDELRLVEGLRTFGVGAAGVATLLGLLVVLTGVRSLVGLALDVGPLVVLVLLVDRHVERGDRITRAGILAPAIIALAAAVFVNFGGNLLGGLYVGALAAGLSVVVTTLIATRRASWAFVPVLVATAWSPTCLSLPTFVQTCAAG